MYAGTKKWGSVRVTIKRQYTELHKHKDSMSKERKAARRQEAASKSEFDLVVRAQSPRRKITTFVEAQNVIKFQRALL